VFDANQYGARCQPLLYSPTSLSINRADGDAGYSEDCLNLNIFTPPAAANATAKASNRSGTKAVMVWIHGGCSGYGSNQAAVYDGAPLATTQDVVVVSINYRLGALGFLGHDALRYRDPDSGSTGNWGTLDAIAALRWVHHHIAAFGGDRDRVTLFGESSGAGLISQLLGAEPAWPYYHRAIMESGAGSAWTYQDIRAAYHNFDMTAKHAGCGPGSLLPQDTKSIAEQIRCLLASPADVVASGLGDDIYGYGFRVYCRDGCSWGPVIDGALLKGRPLDLARSGRIRPDTPLIAGHNLNDGALFVPTYGGKRLHTESERLEYFARRFGPNHVAALEEAFPVPAHAQAGTDVSRYYMSAQSCETDFSYACATYWLAAMNRAPSYIYQFSQVSPTTGLCLHGYEIQYVFGTGHFATKEQQRVSSLTMDYWASFARDGSPWAADGAQWPEWREGTDLRSEKGTSRDIGRQPWPEPRQPGAMLNITASPSVVIVHPNAKGCAFLAREWEYLQVCLPENPKFNLSGPEVTPFIAGAAQPSFPSAAAASLQLARADRQHVANGGESVTASISVDNTTAGSPEEIHPAGKASSLLHMVTAAAACALCFGSGMAVERLFQLRKRRAGTLLTATPLLFDTYEHKA
jgi:para-nitrobenzyl esterase